MSGEETRCEECGRVGATRMSVGTPPTPCSVCGPPTFRFRVRLIREPARTTPNVRIINTVSSESEAAS